MAGIYVETVIKGSIDEVWDKTQVPEIHQRWDLRFTQISYLPKQSESEPQQFLYSTRIGFGLRIDGKGETVGNRDNDTKRVSALKFWSDDPKSLIREGSGYWKYIQTPDGVKFLTWYDYQTRFGLVGYWFDRILFRPILGWATAWSFDRLRLWIEQGIDPGISLRMALNHALARLAIAAIWLYHGLVPKLLLHHHDEINMMISAGVPPQSTSLAISALGIIEILLGLLTLLTWRNRWTLLITIALMIAAFISVLFTAPGYIGAAFNPFSLNLAMIALAIIGFISALDIPSAGRCLRRPKEDQS